MKSNIEILIAILIILSVKYSVIGQTSDSINVISFPDSTTNLLLMDSSWVKVLDESLSDEPLWIQKGLKESYPISFDVPTCSCLSNQNGLWFLNNAADPYTGRCVVMSNSTPKDSVHFSFVPRGTYEHSDLVKYRYNLNQDENHLGDLRIISTYFEGKRDETRSYFNTDGSLNKVEFYNHGELEWTKYYSSGEVINIEKN